MTYFYLGLIPLNTAVSPENSSTLLGIYDLRNNLYKVYI